MEKLTFKAQVDFRGSVPLIVKAWESCVLSLAMFALEVDKDIT